jgi:hypothetical protein
LPKVPPPAPKTQALPKTKFAKSAVIKGQHLDIVKMLTLPKSLTLPNGLEMAPELDDIAKIYIYIYK